MSIYQSDAAKALGATLRTKMLDKLNQMGDPEEELRKLFDLIDVNKSMLLR